MVEVIWPAAAPLRPVRNSVTGGPRMDRYSFETESGIPIDRPLTTALIKQYDIRLPQMTRDDFAEWDAWYQGDLGMGTRRFVWLHPMTDRFALCRILGGEQSFTEQQGIKNSVIVGFRMLILPQPVDQTAYVIRSGGYIEAMP